MPTGTSKSSSCDELLVRAGHRIARAALTRHSHIFCLQCADILGLARAISGHRVCPACKSELDNPDDCAVAQLSPPPDYKSSILCGLTPSDIMECTSKGLEFFTYQAAQEMQVAPSSAHEIQIVLTRIRAFQLHVRSNATAKCAEYKKELVQVETNAKGTIDALEDQLKSSYRTTNNDAHS